MNRKPPGEAVSNNQAANSLTRLTCPLAQVEAIILFGSKSLKTRITVITFAIVLLGSWSLALLVSRLLERDMVQLLSNQQFSLATLLATGLTSNSKKELTGTHEIEYEQFDSLAPIHKSFQKAVTKVSVFHT